MTDTPSVAPTPEPGRETIEESGADDREVEPHAQEEERRAHGPIGGIDPAHSTQKGPQWSRDLAAQRQALLTQSIEARTAPAAPGLTPQQLKKRERQTAARRAKTALAIATHAIEGCTNQEIAERIGMAESSVRRIRRHPDFATACDRARAALRQRNEQTSEVARGKALKAAETILDGFNAGTAEVSVSEAMKAATLIEAASRPTPTQYAHQARKQLLLSLSTKLRNQVAQELRNGGSDFVDFNAMTEDELDALLGEED